MYRSKQVREHRERAVYTVNIYVICQAEAEAGARRLDFPLSHYDILLWCSGLRVQYTRTTGSAHPSLVELLGPVYVATYLQSSLAVSRCALHNSAVIIVMTEYGNKDVILRGREIEREIQ